MEILEAYDLTGTLRGAAALAGCDHKTVAYWLAQRERTGGMPVVERQRPAMALVFAGKIDELVDRSSGRIRADVAHAKLVALGYQGSARTTRRWVAESKRRWRHAHEHHPPQSRRTQGSRRAQEADQSLCGPVIVGPRTPPLQAPSRSAVAPDMCASSRLRGSGTLALIITDLGAEVEPQATSP